jgi:F-type H+-transporting ATPase subunit b
MPQLAQLSEVFLSQMLWLGIALGFIFFVIGRGMVPKIQATVDAREAKIQGDLEAAQKAREDAEAREAAWREKMDAARSEALKLTQEAKQASARDTEDKVKASAAKLAKSSDAAEARIRDSLASARAEIEQVAAEATRDMVARLTGISVDGKDAQAAVKAQLHG